MERIQSHARVDLAVILLIFALVASSIPWLDPMLRRGHGLAIFWSLCLYQFAIEGAAPLALMASRGERGPLYNFHRRGLLPSLALGGGLAVFYDAGLSLVSRSVLWVPLIRQPAARLALAEGLPFAPFGLSIVALLWGMLEGFFGIYFARKVDLATGHDGRGWLSPGVWSFALFNGAVHGLVGQGLAGFLSSFASGYAIAVVPAVTGNAWGGALVQLLTNAVGTAPSEGATS